MNILMIGGGVVCAGLLIVAVKKSNGPLMALIQGITAVVLIFNGIRLAPEGSIKIFVYTKIFILPYFSVLVFITIW